MDKSKLKKNRLDLEYQELLQKINAIYIGFFIGILSFIGTWIWQPPPYKFGLLITIIFIIILFYFFENTKRRMYSKLIEIENI